MNVYPWEIEQVLLRHPAVAEAAVIGVPDADFGEVARAVVRAAVPVTPTLEEALVAHCRAHLAGPKVPRRIDFAEELPRSETGKLLRRVLKERYRDGAALSVA
ncbi:AMP-binding enzyme [Teichococcus aestuarii]|uniref:AMP-binding enzyme n=1 Tax=Teichococcus aestuarii TaxID=568898 RepID=UPI00360B7F6E